MSPNPVFWAVVAFAIVMLLITGGVTAWLGARLRRLRRRP
jgi:hypothetical protein